MIGSFGPVPFEVSDREILTVSDLKRTRSAEFAVHKVVDGRARLQFCGVGLAEVSFTVTLHRSFTDPVRRIADFDAVLEAGNSHALMIGGRRLGDFVLERMSETARIFVPGSGALLEAQLNLTLKEYA